MRRLLLVIIILLIPVSTFAAGVSHDTLAFGRFGTVHLYQATTAPQRVVIFISGDGGWNLGVVDMAKTLATLDALVIGVNITHYLKELEAAKDECSYPAGDFEALSQYIQKKLQLADYIIPCLVGYSSGATLTYAILVQAPPNTFQGAMSLGFCPDLPLTKPLCRGNGLEWGPGPKDKGYSFKPSATLQMPWIAFQGQIDQVCDAKDVETYVKQVNKAQLILLPKVGHGFSVQKNWLPQFTKAFKQLDRESQIDKIPDESQLKGLPLVEVPADSSATDLLAVVISGDGGWASIDRQIGGVLAKAGIPVVGLNALKYFWNRRTPDEASADLNRIIRFYLDKWHKHQVVVVGYSRGADVMPFMVNRLPADLLPKIRLVALLGPERSVDFQFHLTDFLGNPGHKSDLPTRPEVEKLRGTRVLCVCGDKENESLCNDLDSTLAETIRLKGGHHFSGDYESVAKLILDRVR